MQKKNTPPLVDIEFHTSPNVSQLDSVTSSHYISLKVRFVIIFLSASRSFLRLSYQIRPNACYIPAHFMQLYLINLTTFGEQNKL